MLNVHALINWNKYSNHTYIVENLKVHIYSVIQKTCSTCWFKSIISAVRRRGPNDTCCRCIKSMFEPKSGSNVRGWTVAVKVSRLTTRSTVEIHSTHYLKTHTSVEKALSPSLPDAGSQGWVSAGPWIQRGFYTSPLEEPHSCDSFRLPLARQSNSSVEGGWNPVTMRFLPSLVCVCVDELLPSPG